MPLSHKGSGKLRINICNIMDTGQIFLILNCENQWKATLKTIHGEQVQINWLYEWAEHEISLDTIPHLSHWGKKLKVWEHTGFERPLYSLRWDANWDNSSGGKIRYVCVCMCAFINVNLRISIYIFNSQELLLVRTGTKMVKRHQSSVQETQLVTESIQGTQWMTESVPGKQLMMETDWNSLRGGKTAYEQITAR